MIEGFSLNGEKYLYLKDITGVIYATINMDGNIVGQYSYDSYRKILSITNSNNNNIADKNPIRYKDYYYDSNTKLYYLKSRYYNPLWRRFISPDNYKYLNTSSIYGLNLYAYSDNPVNYSDRSGHFPILALLIGAGIDFLTSYIPDVISEMQDGFDWSDFNTFEDNWIKYVDATLGRAIGGLIGFVSYVVFSPANVTQLTFASGASTGIVFGYFSGPKDENQEIQWPWMWEAVSY